MHLVAEHLAMPKEGSADSEYEDAYWPQHPARGCQRFAVADGATETSFSGIWANLLVEAYGAGGFDKLPSMDWLSELQGRWWSLAREKPLPWYAEEKLQSGTFAAVVGLTLDWESGESEHGTWHAEAIGDSCLVQLRDGNVLVKFPLHGSEDFTNSPVLLSARAGEHSGIDSLVCYKGQWECGDEFYLMTDAVASWFFRAMERGEAPWETVWELDNPRPFRNWVETARRDNLMRNDDVTLYRIQIRE